MSSLFMVCGCTRARGNLGPICSPNAVTSRTCQAGRARVSRDYRVADKCGSDLIAQTFDEPGGIVCRRRDDRKSSHRVQLADAASEATLELFGEREPTARQRTIPVTLCHRQFDECQRVTFCCDEYLQSGVVVQVRISGTENLGGSIGR